MADRNITDIPKRAPGGPPSTERDESRVPRSGPQGRGQYRDALVELMAQGTRGAVIVNMAMPPGIPAIARIPASVISAAGFAGVQAFRSLWDGAMGRPLVEPRYRGPVEEVASGMLTSSAVATSGSIAIGRSVPKALSIGGRVGLAVAAGDASAEVVRQVASHAHAGSFGQRAQELIGMMQSAGGARLATAIEATSSAVGATRSGVRALSEWAAASVGSAADAVRSAADSVGGAVRDARDAVRDNIFGPEPQGRERPLPRRATANSDAETAIQSALETRTAPPRAAAVLKPISSIGIEGYWRTRRIADSPRQVREYVRPHMRQVG